MPRAKQTRAFAEGLVPLLDVEGSAYEAGLMLGDAWAPTLKHMAGQASTTRSSPWWMTRPFAGLVSRHAPHLPDLYRGMARAARLPEKSVGITPPAEGSDECTSFAVGPHVTLDRRPISGQTKDTPDNRVFRYVVLRLKIKDAPSALTLTYPGRLFGHGFVSGGCAVFRNSLYAGRAEGKLPYEVWGLLALHCRTVDQAVELARRYGVNEAAHCTIADDDGVVVGIEMSRGGLSVLKSTRGVYTHANHVASGRRLRQYESYEQPERQCSVLRESRLRERLETERGRLTAQSAYAALCDHAGYPASICRHRSRGFDTTAAVVAEPTRGLLHVTRGAPCQNWPKTYRL